LPLVGVVEKTINLELLEVMIMAALEALRDQGLLSTPFSLFRRKGKFWDQLR
jgi:hypothetical protein